MRVVAIASAVAALFVILIVIFVLLACGLVLCELGTLVVGVDLRQAAAEEHQWLWLWLRLAAVASLLVAPAVERDAGGERVARARDSRGRE